MSAIDTILVWVGGLLMASVGLLAVLIAWYLIVEYALRIFKLKRLILEYYAGKLKRSQPRIITPKPKRDAE